MGRHLGRKHSTQLARRFSAAAFLPFNLLNQTVREKVRVSLGGDRLRIVLSNEYGKSPLAIGSVHIALPARTAPPSTRAPIRRSPSAARSN